MRADDLQKFILSLDQAGELRRVACSVDAHLEIAAILNALSRERGCGPALLFENVRGYALPLAANLFASRKRIELALGADVFIDLPAKLRDALVTSGAKPSSHALRHVVSCRENQAVYVDDAPCFDVDVSAVGLDALPALVSWPEDGGRYLTLGQVFSYHPDTYMANCGMYRVQLVDRDKALLRCHPGSGGAEHLAAWHGRGQAMPVAIALGGPPVLTWLAGVSLPGDVAETDFAGYVLGHPLALARCRDKRLAVPATAEIVIEGRIFPGEELTEGPFGNHTGRYEPAAPAPVIRAERVSMREGAVYPCTLVGPPPRENSCLAELTERTLLVLLQFDHPWVLDLHMPVEGIFHRAAFVAVAPDCTQSLQDMSQALWSSALLKNSRLLVLLDAGTPLRDFGVVYWRVVNATGLADPCSIDTQRVVLDARSPAGSRKVEADVELVKTIMARWHEYGLDRTK